ncbi:MAG: GIY-YIG nuclease family protein [Senegalimassilia anaerobia]|uniref:GIY-YIG nuclease family protein n=1 Tax=Senegalimassilia anaerobia TaxID=1473216 RepID=UPI002E79397D|nr:GIY-YIG nuclease family protein [Senegalimassilia anaerobia]MEE0303482.1 GIY-YIG nuclease family protein [Senegalimassilia anaerobia]
MASYQHISHGFEPVFDERSRILVLGSFPSVLSRENAFYYGNPQNRFWRVMAACLDEPVPQNEGGLSDDGRPLTLEESIAAKKQMLLEHGIALWDVIASCDIKGSSDASIKNVVPAQVERVLEKAHIGAVICNGGTAGRLYKRYLQWQVGLAAHVLPSTSPANAAWQLERLTARWQEELLPLLEAAETGALGEVPSPSSVKRGFVTAKTQVAKRSSVNGADGGHASDPQDDTAANANEAGGGHRAARSDDAATGTPTPSATDGTAKSASAWALADEATAVNAIAGTTGESRVDIVTVRVPSPPASNYAVHKNMQGNKRANTKPELLVRERLRKAGLTGYRLQWKAPGHPDIAWPGKRVAIEVRGCFWHRCPHCNPSTPKKNTEYWEAKFARNTERDAENVRKLEEMGWRVHVIWECQLKKNAIDATMADLLPKLAAELGKELAEAPAANETGQQTNASATTGKRHFMYVIECADGSLYTGYSPDVQARFAAHQAGTGAKYTRGRGPLNLLAVAEFATKHDAMSAEYRFKHLSRDRKDELLAKAAEPEADFAKLLQEEFGL